MCYYKSENRFIFCIRQLHGDPKEMPSTKMLRTSVCIQRITSYLVHINLSMCISFHNVSTLKWSHFRFFSKCVPNDTLWYCRHTCKLRTKLSMPQTYYPKVIALILAVIAVFMSQIAWRMFSFTRSFRQPQREKSRGLIRVNVRTT